MKIIRELRLYPTPDQSVSLLTTMRAMNAASNEAASVGFETKTFHPVGIQKKCYFLLREKFKLSAQMAIRAIAKVGAFFSRDRRKCPEFRPLGAVGYDARMLTHKPAKSSVSLLTLEGRILVPYKTAERNLESLADKWGEARLICRGAAFYLHVSVEVITPSPSQPKVAIGVDLGINNIATLSTGQTFTGESVSRARARYARQRARLQRKNTRSARRKFRQVSGKERRFVKDVNHVVSRRIVDTAKALQVGLVIEDLSGIRKKRSGSKKVRTLVNSWSFAQLRNFLTYKAALAGVPLEVVKSQYTSQTCSACGHCEPKNRKRAAFKCLSCGFQSDSDLNAALNIARRGEPKMPAKAGGPKSTGLLREATQCKPPALAGGS